MLDPTSRRTAHFFTARLLVIVVVPLAFSLRAEHPLDIYIAGVLLLSLLCAVVSALMGLVEGQQPGAPSLNFWDEVLAYTLVAGLARAAAWTVG